MLKIVKDNKSKLEEIINYKWWLNDRIIKYK